MSSRSKARSFSFCLKSGSVGEECAILRNQPGSVFVEEVEVGLGRVAYRDWDGGGGAMSRQVKK